MQPNGLTVVVVPLPSVHRVVIEAHVRIGPRFERELDNGVSHFLEHMLYRGTPSLPSAHEQALAFETLGGTLGAATYVDHGTLGISVPGESYPATLERFAEVVCEPIFTGIEVEKGIVREEILEGLEEDGTDVDPDNLARELSFPGHPLGFPITGTLAHLERMTVEQLRDHHRRHYTARNMVVTVAGPVDPSAVAADVARVLGGLVPGEIPTSPPPPPATGPLFRFTRHSASQTELRVTFRAPSEHDALEAATDMLLRVIDDGMSTRLYHRICDELGLCYDVSAAYEAYADSGLFDVAASSEHARAPEVLSEILSLLETLAEHGPTSAELDKAKARARWQLTEMRDDPAETASFFGLGYLTGVLRTPEERLESLLAVEREDARRAAETVFRPENLVVVAVGAAKKQARAALERRVAGFGR